MKTKEKFRKSFKSVMPGDNAVFVCQKIEEWLLKHEKDILNEYNQFLLENGYCDTDIEQEEPTAIDQFLTQ